MKENRQKLIGVGSEDLAPILSENANVGPTYAVDQLVRGVDTSIVSWYLRVGTEEERRIVSELLRKFRPVLKNRRSAKQRTERDRLERHDAKKLFPTAAIDLQKKAQQPANIIHPDTDSLIDVQFWKGRRGAREELASRWDVRAEVALWKMLRRRALWKRIRERIEGRGETSANPGGRQEKKGHLKHRLQRIKKCGLKYRLDSILQQMIDEGLVRSKTEQEALARSLRKENALSQAHYPIRLLEQLYLEQEERQPAWGAAIPLRLALREFGHDPIAASNDAVRRSLIAEVNGNS